MAGNTCDATWNSREQPAKENSPGRAVRATGADAVRQKPHAKRDWLSSPSDVHPPWHTYRRRFYPARVDCQYASEGCATEQDMLTFPSLKICVAVFVQPLALSVSRSTLKRRRLPKGSLPCTHRAL